MSDPASPSDGLCDRCSRFLHFKSGEGGVFGEDTDEDGTVRLDFFHPRDGKDLREVESQFQLEDDYPAMTGLRRSVSRGCGFCYLLVIAIEEKVSMSKKKKVHGTFNRLLVNRGYVIFELPKTDPAYLCGLAVEWRIMDSKSQYGSSWPQSHKSCFKLLANRGTTAAQYLRLLHTPLNPSLFSSENIAFTKQILSNCSETHESCAENGAVGHCKHQVLPSRLLQISKDQTGYKICLTKMPPTTSSGPERPNPKYAALSYCWGKREFIKSTLENITDHYNNLRFSQLPQGFQDIIELCWGIGIFYIWIDSLCIIQGDQSDLDRESARMKDVYANAFLTIILASTRSPLEGPSKCPVKHPLEAQVSYSLGGGDAPRITYSIQSVPPTEKDYGALIVPQHYYEESILQSKWSERGWTFQESYLSTRKLYVCPGHIDFSCKTSSHLQGVLRTFLPLDDLGYSSGIAEDWYSLVGAYSRRKLSRSEDKLPAISAVASQKGEELGNYVAGLWTKELEKGLLWWPARDPQLRSPLRRQKTYRGPTWSWCAYDGPITYDFVRFSRGFRRAFEILEIGWTLAEPSAIYGRLSTADGDRAYLRIRTKVVALTAQSIKNEECPSGVKAVVEYGGAKMHGWTFLDCGGTEGFNNPQRVVAILVATRTSSVVNINRGLLLRPIASLGTEMTYERVGYFDDRYDGFDLFKDITDSQELCLV